MLHRITRPAFALALTLAAAACGGGESTAPTTTTSTSTTSTTSTSTSTTSTTTTTTLPGPPGRRPPIECGTGNLLEDDRLEPDFAVGTIRHLDIVSSDTSLSSTIEAIRMATLQVGALRSNGNRAMEWRNGETFLAGLPIDMDEVAETHPELADVIARVEDTPIRYEINDFGEISAVTNTDELTDLFSDTFDALAPLLGGEDLTDQVREVFTSPEFINQALTEDVQVAHTFLGFLFRPGEPRTFDDLLQNMLGGPLIPAITTLTMGEERDEDGCVVVSLVTEIDPDGFRDVMVETLTSLTGETPTEEDLAEFDDFEITNTTTAQYDPATGWFRSVIAAQEISAGSRTQGESVAIYDVTEE